MSHFAILDQLTLNTLRSRQNGCHFADGILNAFCGMKMYDFWLRFHWELITFHSILLDVITQSCPSIALASHLCTCVLHRQLCYLHTLKLPKIFNFHGDFHQKWHFAHPEFSFAHPELPFLAKSMCPRYMFLVLKSSYKEPKIQHNKTGYIF